MQAHPAAVFCIHILTASGAAWAFLALQAAIEDRWSAMFFWLGIALVVDAFDGPLARYCKVNEALPRWSGKTLDLVIDFLTYVFVPAYAIAMSGLLPASLETPAGILIMVTGALYFADQRMKTPDNYFRGFPALWNVAAFYLLLLKPSPSVAAATVAVLAVLTFVPFPFIHPFRVGRLRPFNIVVFIMWAVLAGLAVARDMAPGVWVTGGLCAIALYIVGIGIFRSIDKGRSET